ncbi:hypothetical protein Shyhy01_10900 [Streptomyces hygroscopicus subsp. hygroscopicus]|nr:hypothetical protein Shyhy01_10900 [Streptomyces hygroscopicus subsp. hygroscopicus]
MAEIDPECLFEGGDGRAALLDLFWTVRLLSLRDRVVTVCAKSASGVSQSGHWTRRSAPPER